MSGAHLIGDAGRHETPLRTWGANGLQLVMHVNPEPNDGAKLRAWLGGRAFLVWRHTNNTDLRDSEIQNRYEANPEGEAVALWNKLSPLFVHQIQYNALQFNNEPVFQKVDPNASPEVQREQRAKRDWQIKQLCKFTKKLVDIATEHGRGIALFAFARGTPEPEDWPLFYEVWEYALDKNKSLPNGQEHLLAIHQYGSWQTKGRGSLRHEKKYHICRYEELIRPTLPPRLKRAKYAVLESGPDHPGGWKVVYGQDDAGRQACVDDWHEQQVWLATQAGCVGAAFFTLGQQGGFSGFDIADDPILGMLAAKHYPPMKPAEVAPAPQPTPQPTPGGGGPPAPQPTPQPQPIGLAARLATALGDKFVDLRTKLPQNPDKTIRFANTDSRKMRYLVFHHTTGPRTYGPYDIARGHIAKGWAGAGYHFDICMGKLYYLGDVDTQRAHTWGRNHEGIGVTISGTYTTVLPEAEDVAIARVLVGVLDAYYGHKKELTGHKVIALPGHGTSCPGRIMEVLPALRVPGGVVVPNAFDSKPLKVLQKWAFWVEKTAREVQATFPLVHDALTMYTLPAIVAARDRKAQGQGPSGAVPPTIHVEDFTLYTLQKWAYFLEKAARDARTDPASDGVHDAIMQVSQPPVATARDMKQASTPALEVAA